MRAYGYNLWHVDRTRESVIIKAQVRRRIMSCQANIEKGGELDDVAHGVVVAKFVIRGWKKDEGIHSEIFC
jgi:hypothetical protein